MLNDEELKSINIENIIKIVNNDNIIKIENLWVLIEYFVLFVYLFQFNINYLIVKSFLYIFVLFLHSFCIIFAKC